MGLVVIAFFIMIFIGPLRAGPVFDGHLNSSFYLFQNLPADTSVIDTASSLANDWFNDLTLSIRDGESRHHFSVSGELFRRMKDSSRIEMRMPAAYYRYGAPMDPFTLTAGRHLQITDFDLLNLDGMSIRSRLGKGWRFEGAAGLLADTGLKVNGKENLAGYGAVTREIGFRGSVGVSGIRALREGDLIANGVGVHFRYWLARRVDLTGSFNVALDHGWHPDEGRTRITYSPKKFKQRYYLAYRSYHRRYIDPTFSYYYEYLFYDKILAGVFSELPFKTKMTVEGEVLKSGENRYAAARASLVHRFLSLRGEKGFLKGNDDFRISAQGNLIPGDKIGFSAGYDLVHYNSYVTGSSLNDHFSGYFLSANITPVRSLLFRLKVQNRINLTRTYDYRALFQCSYTFSTEPRERFPWEY